MTNKKIYRLSRYGNLLIVNVAIAGNNNIVRKVKLLVDTGSSYTVLRSSLLQCVGCEIQHPLSTVKTNNSKWCYTSPPCHCTSI